MSDHSVARSQRDTSELGSGGHREARLEIARIEVAIAELARERSVAA
jgi:hypothetical protein